MSLNRSQIFSLWTRKWTAKHEKWVSKFHCWAAILIGIDDSASMPIETTHKHLCASAKDKEGKSQLSMMQENVEMKSKTAGRRRNVAVKGFSIAKNGKVNQARVDDNRRREVENKHRQEILFKTSFAFANCPIAS